MPDIKPYTRTVFSLSGPFRYYSKQSLCYCSYINDRMWAILPGLSVTFIHIRGFYWAERSRAQRISLTA